MKIIFFGTSEFAIPSLRELLKSKHQVLAVVTQPDRPSGRRLKLSPPPTKVLALANGISVYQPEDASSHEAVDYLRKIAPDLFVVISFGQILKREVLSVPRLYAINLHGSLLPKYRGAAPTNWAVINQDRTTGVTVIRMNERMDEGDIILNRELDVEAQDTNITLGEKLSEIGASVLLEALENIEKDKAVFTKQDDALATYAPKLKKVDGLIDWSQSAVSIHNRVRGLIPWPGAYTYYEGKVLKIFKAVFQDAASAEDAKAGEVVDVVKNRGVVVRTGYGDLVIMHLQLEGKSILDADSFVRGHKIPRGYKFAS